MNRAWLWLWLCFGVWGCDPRLNAGYNHGMIDAAADASATSPAFVINGAVANLSVNGSAVFFEDELILTPEAEEQVGSAFFSVPLALSDFTSMNVKMVFQIDSSSVPADGFALVWHAAAAGPRALGGRGGSLGFDALTPGVAIVFDTHNGSGFEAAPNVAISRTRSAASAPFASQPEPFALASGKPIHCWIHYQRQTIEVFLAESATKPIVPLLQAFVALHAEVGPWAYLGVTSATGAKFSRHAVQTLQVVVE